MSETRDRPTHDVFATIRSACRAVSVRSRTVTVVTDRIPSYARELAGRGFDRPFVDPEHHFLGSPGETVAYFVTLDAVNFGSGYFPHLHKRPGMSGYYTVATTLADRFRENGPLNAEKLAAIRPADCAAIFNQTLDSGPVEELMGLFARAWNDLGADLLARFGGSFSNLVEAAEESAAALIEILSAQPLFRDVASYRGVSVPLYKRAQILASDLALAFDGKGPGEFVDLDRLTIFADNLVPHVLRLDGVLRFDAELVRRIERGELIPSGSEEEVEIRACAVDAVERIVEALRATGDAPTATAQQLDNFLWLRGQEPRYKARPRHRSRTVFY